jgi:hypothetical protein
VNAQIGAQIPATTTIAFVPMVSLRPFHRGGLAADSAAIPQRYARIPQFRRSQALNTSILCSAQFFVVGGSIGFCRVSGILLFGVGC